MWHRLLRELPVEPRADGGGRRRGCRNDWRRRRRRATGTRSGGSGALARNPGREAHPLGANAEAATGSRSGIELLADDLVDPAMVARHLEAARQAEQWMKVSSRHP
jgi:uncharacterized membrane protein